MKKYLLWCRNCNRLEIVEIDCLDYYSAYCKNCGFQIAGVFDITNLEIPLH